MAEPVCSEQETFERANEDAMKRDSHKFFFYGVLVTLLITIFVEFLLLPLHTIGLNYYYGGEMLFVTPLANIWWVAFFFIGFCLLIYFVVYKKVTPYIMKVPYQGKRAIQIPSNMPFAEKKELFERLHSTSSTIMVMNGLTPEDSERKRELSKSLFGIFTVVKLTITWDNDLTRLDISWENNPESISVAKYLIDCFNKDIDKHCKKDLTVFSKGDMLNSANLTRLRNSSCDTEPKSSLYMSGLAIPPSTKPSDLFVKKE